MPTSKDLRRRIRSIKNTSQITKAMEMVAATKMRRAQLQAVGGRPYNSALQQLVQFLTNSSSAHPLMQIKPNLPTLVIVLSTDKSLCGALNTNLFRLINNQFSDAKTLFITVGNKAKTFLSRTNRQLIADFPNQDKIDQTTAKQIRRTALDLFNSDQIGAVQIVFPNFISTLTQTPTATPLLPIDPKKFLSFLEQQSASPKTETKINQPLVEPNLSEVLEYALLHFLDVCIYQALCETKASEHSSRMIAMQNATQNAKDLVSDLTLAYNQIRQGAITNELLEITSAQLALE